MVHPDATVVCGNANSPRPDCIDNPTIVVEVTSPSTKDYDFGTKREYYFSLSSLRHYLLISQTELQVSLFKRNDLERGAWTWTYLDRGVDASFSIEDVEVRVAEIYRGILS